MQHSVVDLKSGTLTFAGIVKFHECSVSELEVSSDPEDTQSMKSLSLSTTSLLDQFVGQVRESLGVESHLSTSRFVRLGIMLVWNDL